MNFTREPIIETIISPKDGYKLLIRNSKGESFEEYYVEAVEVVSFGRAFFFRSLERPKAFLVPVSDYEVLEVKEARVALKNVSHEKNIKIGGGRENRAPQKEPVEPPPPSEPVESALETAVEARMERKRDRRRHRRRRGRESEQAASSAENEGEKEQDQTSTEEVKSTPLFSSLIPPPPTLISETLSRYREKEAEHKEPSTPETQEPKKEEEDKPNSDSSTLQRVVVQEEETTVFNSSYFTPFTTGNDLFF